MEQLKSYLKLNKIVFKEIDSEFIEINGEKYNLILPNEEGKIFSDQFLLMVLNECDKYVYKFGDNWYWENKEDLEHSKLHELKYIGGSTLNLITNNFLGIRGAYEILNGSRLYDDWCKKAKFIGCKTLGICEKNTLAGILKFQIECKKSNIKSIIGATYTVFREKEDFKYDIKLYVKNNMGWDNLLLINKEVKVINGKYIEEERLLELLDGLFVIMDPKSLDYNKINHLIKEKVDYYQLDTVCYNNEDRDTYYLNNLKKYVRSNIQPISITDAFYLDQEHSHIKKLLNAISTVREYESDNQYFKDKEDYYSELEILFNQEDDSFYDIFKQALKNEQLIVDQCNFEIEINKFYLPDYILTKEQYKKYTDKEDLFWDLIQKGLNKKVNKDNHKLYLDRVDLEYSVIIQGEKLIDYFLILWDIINWCDEQKILVGPGRGSSGGSIIAYLLGITNIDSIKYGLLFERFLNENRVKKSLPDIDSDFEGFRRNEVKGYMEQRFGKDHICSVGIYGSLKLKMLFTDLSRLQSLPVQEVKIMTKILGEGEKDGTDWSEIFYLSCKSEKLKTFVNKYPDIINDSRLALMQPRSNSIHACATIITPNSKDIFKWFPVRREINKDGDNVLVSEWEGGQLDNAGFLKEDILGILELDKMANIIKLIKINTGKEIDFKNIPTEDRKVYRYFYNGWNEDVFQFGTKGLKQYTKSLKPDSIEELSAANALYRPGAMKSNTHNDFILIKFGKKDLEYDYMLEEVTKETYGLYIYQEQAMLAAQKLAGFTPVEADILRKVILVKGKKGEFQKKEEYKEKFINGAVNNGCKIKIAEGIWDKLEAFSGYGFNHSHSVAYAILGYISQWFKVHYPMEFWTTAFKFGKEDKIADYISEINQTGDIRIMSVDINNSKDNIHTDFKKKTIYWPLSSIKQCGDIATTQIMEIRDRDGQYFTFEEFIERNRFKGGKVGKAVVENLVMSGAFDELEHITLPRSRFNLISQYRKINKTKIDKEKDIFELNKSNLQEDWFWTLQQKRLSGIAFFNYKDLVSRYLDTDDEIISIENFQLEGSVRKKVKIGGYIAEFEERNSKKGKWARMRLESNYAFINITVWSEQYKQIEKLNLAERTKSLLLISGQIVWDSYKKENVLQTTDDSELIILE